MCCTIFHSIIYITQVIEVSADRKCIIGGEVPLRMIPIAGKTSAEVTKLLDGTADMKIPRATEVKITVMSFQHSPAGVPKTEIVATLPQGNSDSNDFVKEMEASSEAAARSGNGRCLNFCIDGVSAESRYVWMALCLFLSCESNHTGSTDPSTT